MGQVNKIKVELNTNSVTGLSEQNWETLRNGFYEYADESPTEVQLAYLGLADLHGTIVPVLPDIVEIYEWTFKTTLTMGLTLPKMDAATITSQTPVVFAPGDTVADYGVKLATVMRDSAFKVKGSDHQNAFTGGDYDDTFKGKGGIDEFHGGDGDDKLIGNDGDDILLGEDGRDSLRGGADNDILIAGIGDDKLRGGKGNDILVFDGMGDDTGRGGEGADLFVFDTYGGGRKMRLPIEATTADVLETPTATTVVKDFDATEDVILLTGTDMFSFEDLGSGSARTLADLDSADYAGMGLTWSQDGKHLIIEWNNHIIKLKNVTAADIDLDRFGEVGRPGTFLAQDLVYNRSSQFVMADTPTGDFTYDGTLGTITFDGFQTVSETYFDSDALALWSMGTT